MEHLQEESKELQDEREEEIKENIYSGENERQTPKIFSERGNDFQIPFQELTMLE